MTRLEDICFFVDEEYTSVILAMVTFVIERDGMDCGLWRRRPLSAKAL